MFYGDLAVRGSTVELTLQLPDSAIAAVLGSRDLDAATSRDEALRSADALVRRLAQTITVEGDGHRCLPPERASEARTADKADGFFLLVGARWDCQHAVSTVRFTDALFFDVDARHELMLRVLVPGAPPANEILRDSRRTVTVTRAVGWGERAVDGVRLGIEHIFTGYDHLAFLFALLAAARLASLRRGLVDVARVVTAFTVAHSITLVAAGLDLVRLPGRVVEPAIALSIAAVAAGNLWRTLRSDETTTPTTSAWRQAAIAFGFGLVHGFGFASVLRERALPADGLVATLLSFNVGVEIGQLAIVAVVAPALALAARALSTPRRLVAAAGILALAALLAAVLMGAGLGRAQVIVAVGGGALALIALTPRVGYTRAVGAGSALVLLPLSLFWFVERVVERSFFGGIFG